MSSGAYLIPAEVVGTAEFQAWFLGRTAMEQQVVIEAVTKLELVGMALGWPHAAAVEGTDGRLRELRPCAGKSELRVVYALDPALDALLLLDGDASGDSTFYECAVPRAAALLQRILAARGAPGPEQPRLAHPGWSEIEARSKLSRARVAELEHRAERELIEGDLHLVRELAGKSPAEVAAMIEKVEGRPAGRRADHRFSTLRRLVEALGGELEVVARLGRRRVRLRGV